MPDAKRKKVSHGQEKEAEAKAQADIQVLSGVTIHDSDGLNTYEKARICNELRDLWRRHNMRGRITVTLDYGRLV